VGGFVSLVWGTLLGMLALHTQRSDVKLSSTRTDAGTSLPYIASWLPGSLEPALLFASLSPFLLCPFLLSKLSPTQTATSWPPLALSLGRD
jgi:hypothetical protein